MRQAGEAQLTARHEKAIAALLSETSTARAAEAAGVGERTLHRWLGEPAFCEALRLARRRAFDQSISQAHRYASAAVQTLARVMADPVSTANARVAAASAILRFGREAIELDDIEMRVSALEARAVEGPPAARGNPFEHLDDGEFGALIEASAKLVKDKVGAKGVDRGATGARAGKPASPAR